MSRWQPRNVTPCELRSMYLAEGLSGPEIAEKLGRGASTIWRWLKHDGIARSRPEAAAMPRRRSAVAKAKYKHGLDSEGYRIAGRKKKLHREIAEAILARPLTSSEVVHHVNECKSDNRPANLWVFPNNKAHKRFHAYGEIHPDTIKLVPYCGEAA